MQIFAKSIPSKARLTLGLLVMGSAVFSFAFDGGDVMAQSSRELSNRIERLEKEIETLSRAYYRGEKPPAGSFSGGASDASQADMQIRLSQLETELRSIRGQFEEQSYETRQLREELERVKGDLELRIQDLESGNASGVTGNSGGGAKYINRGSSSLLSNEGVSSGASVSSGATGVNGNGGYRWQSGENVIETQPQKQAAGQLGSYNQSASGVRASEDLAAATYENAFSLLKKENYDVAEKEFQIFLNEYPTHSLAGNAKYWLGETYYVRGDFERAARTFAEGFKQYPDNSKTADNLLKLGMSLGALDKKDDACVALSQIEKEGFQASAPVLRRASQEKTRLGC